MGDSIVTIDEFVVVDSAAKEHKEGCSLKAEYFELKEEKLDLTDNQYLYKDSSKEEEITVLYEHIAKKEVKMSSRCHEDYPEIEVRYDSQITGYDMSCKERMEMIRMGLPCHLGRVKEKFIFWCRVCQIQLNSEDTVVKHIGGSRHFKMKLREKEVR